MSATVVVSNARLELLRSLAMLRDLWRQIEAAEGWEREDDPVPLFGVGATWRNAPDDLLLAARECSHVGEVSCVVPERLTERALYGAFVWITDVGYDRIRAHDALGEAAQGGG